MLYFKVLYDKIQYAVLCIDLYTLNARLVNVQQKRTKFEIVWFINGKCNDWIEKRQNIFSQKQYER